MTTKGILKEADFDVIDKEVEKAIDDAVEFADNSPKPVRIQQFSLRMDLPTSNVDL